MKLFGILGFPLGHSYSPAYFNEKFRREGIDARYLTFELEDLAAFPALIARTPELCGLNVTIPHKQRILPYLDTLSPEARAVWIIPTKVISWEVSLSNLIFNFSMLPEVLCDSRIP